ncbi:hypothetical protein RB195_013672 [Necator americanus]|uniref:Leucine Rich repeat-containing domain protein n=1 Tax=Necator americanus TaxID=51031 RepID=A0ABR1DWM4_NECAM
MNEGTSRRTADIPQINCLFVHAEFSYQDALAERMETAAICERKRKDAATERAISLVYNNDLLMRHIISFVTNMNDRVNVELSSSRLRNISRTAMWRFRSGGHTLSLTYKTFNDYVSVEIGDVWFVLPSTTMESRTQGTTCKTAQPPKLINTLYGMAERFALEIRNIILGGVDMESRSRGVQNHQLIVTSDLLRFINDRLKNLKTISFAHCGFDGGAVAYLSSHACSLPLRISELMLDSIWFDSSRLMREFTLLLSPSLRVLHLEGFSIHNLGVELLNRIRELNTILDDFHIRLSTSTVHGLTLQDIRSFLDTSSAITHKLGIDILCSHSKRRDRFFLALRILPKLCNISELQLLVQPTNRRELEDLAHILSNLWKLPLLQKISCGDWRSYEMSIALYNGLLHCESLKAITISNIVECNPDEMATLLSGIPRQVQSLSLKHLSIIDMNLVDTCERLSSLRDLKLVKLPRISSRGILQAISLLRGLEFFYCSCPTSAVLLRSIINSGNYEHLRKITLVVTSGYPQDYEELLSKYFFNVCCSKYRSKPRWCHIEVEGRRLRP